MKVKSRDSNQILDELMDRYPALSACRLEILSAYKMLKSTYLNGGKLLVAGNGGSAADSEHIAAELMKSFLFKREINKDFCHSLIHHYGNKGEALAKKLEGALSAIPLTSMPALSTAFSNDVDPTVTFAQMVYGYGNQGDAFLGISTSGNSQNIIDAVMAAKAKGMQTIGFTGKSGGELSSMCDVAVHAPAEETYKIQEYHLPIYHALCAMLEAELFEEAAL